MTTAIIGTGGIGSVITRQLASGGETLRLASADHESAPRLAAAAIKPEFDPTDPGRRGHFQWAEAVGVRSQKWPGPR